MWLPGKSHSNNCRGKKNQKGKIHSSVFLLGTFYLVNPLKDYPACQVKRTGELFSLRFGGDFTTDQQDGRIEDIANIILMPQKHDPQQTA